MLLLSHGLGPRQVLLRHRCKSCKCASSLLIWNTWNTWKRISHPTFSIYASTVVYEKLVYKFVSTVVGPPYLLESCGEATPSSSWSSSSSLWALCPLWVEEDMCSGWGQPPDRTVASSPSVLDWDCNCGTADGAGWATTIGGAAFLGARCLLFPESYPSALNL